MYVETSEPRWGRLPMRLGWVFKKAHRPQGASATARALWHVVVRGWVYEVCPCGRPVSGAIRTYWLAPDDLWEQVNGRSEGVLCPRCFADRAAAQGVTVAWLGARMEDVDRLVTEARPARGLDRSVCLRDVVTVLRSAAQAEYKGRGIGERAAAFLEREFGRS